MKVLVKGEIKEAINRCRPSKVAVAYIGADWKTFIPHFHHLSAIIVSPTFGSNPRAIMDLAKQIGWEKIHFLNELHAKIYIGNISAVVGSANLTSNGLSGHGLIELCVEVGARNSLKKLDATFDTLMQRAQEQYPTTESKRARIRELEMVWAAAIVNRIVRGKGNNISTFSEFEPLGEDHFYVLWYQPVDCEYSDKVKAIESLVTDEMHFAASDKVEKNKWALVWRITASSKPHKNVKPKWLYIHEVFENGLIDEGYEYPKCAIQRNDLDVPPAPFEITDEVRDAFNSVVQEKDIAKYLIQKNADIFSLAQSLIGIPSLISKMKEYMKKR